MSGPTREGFEVGAQGVRLAWKIWAPERPWGTLLLIHGLGEHSGRYGPLAGFLATRGLSVFAFDLRGHGRSEGPRGDVDGFSRYLEDVLEMEASLERRLPGNFPRFLLGHSMGGLIALTRLQALKSPYSGAVLSAPWLATNMPAWVRRVGRGLGRFFPRLPLPSAIGPERLTRDPEMIRRWREDPLIHTRITARLFREAEGKQEEILERLDSMALPLLFLVPEADPVVDPGVTTRFVRTLSGGAVQLEGLPGFKHEPFNEVGREEVFEKVGEWLQALRDRSLDLP